MKCRESCTVAEITEEFEPYCIWKTDGGDKILAIHLNGFQRDKLKVVIGRNDLKVSGNRLVDRYTKQRFERSFPIPENCDKDRITSKFTGGILNITFPINEEISDSDDKSTASTSMRNISEMALKVTEKVAMLGFAAYLYKCCPCPYTQN